MFFRTDETFSHCLVNRKLSFVSSSRHLAGKKSFLAFSRKASFLLSFFCREQNKLLFSVKAFLADGDEDDDDATKARKRRRMPTTLMDE